MSRHLEVRTLPSSGHEVSDRIQPTESRGKNWRLGLILPLNRSERVLLSATRGLLYVLLPNLKPECAVHDCR